jgi:hypothetical protein
VGRTPNVDIRILKAVYDMIIECETINLTDFGDMYDA